MILAVARADGPPFLGNEKPGIIQNRSAILRIEKVAMEIVQSALKIVYYPHPSLRYPAVPLTAIDRKVHIAAAAMLELMYEHKGLGLAGPQVGLPYQMFVTNYVGDPEQKDQEFVLINPVILERKGSQEGDEGCLSFPGLFRNVHRARTVKVQAYNLQGQLIEGEYSDLPARLWQHEIDHLHAVLFIDKFGWAGQLASRGTLQAFERDYRRGQQKGEIPSDKEIMEMLRELEKDA